MGLGIDEIGKKNVFAGTKAASGVSSPIKTSGAGAVSESTDKKGASSTSGSVYADNIAKSADKGVNKMSKAETKAVLQNMIANEKDPVKKKALEESLAKLDEEDKEKASTLAQQPQQAQQAQQAQQSSGCGGGGGCGGGNKTGGCNGANSANSVNQNGKVDKQSAMENLYIAEKNLQAANGAKSNPFAPNKGNKEEAQKAYEQAKAVAQQAGVTDQEYEQFKQQKQEEEKKKQVQ